MVGNFYHKRLQMSQSDLLCLAIHGFKSSVSSHKYLISNNFNLTEPIIFFKTVIRLLEHECCHKKASQAEPCLYFRRILLLHGFKKFTVLNCLLRS